MNILRNNLQIELNKLHVAVLKTADHYLHAAKFVNNNDLGELFNSLAETRFLLAKEIESAIRSADDLPSVPNEGQEAYEQALQRLEVFLSTNEESDIIAQKLRSELELNQLLESPKMKVLDDNHQQLKQACFNSIEHAREQLEMAQILRNKN